MGVPGELQQDVSVHGSAADAELLRQPDSLNSVIAPVSSSSVADILFKDWSVEYKNCPRWGKDFF